MKRYLFIPVLLTAAVGPYVAGEKDWSNNLGTKFTAFTNQISGSSSSSLSDLPNTGGSSLEQSNTENGSGSSSKSLDSFSSTNSGTQNSSGYGDGSSSSKSSVPAYSASGNSFTSTNSNASSGPNSTLASTGTPGGTGNQAQPSASDPTYDFHEVMRFDVTPRWVISHWPRVTTVLADMELEGLRVPLVTGTKADDIAGSLTYYFDKQHVLQRLAFQGFTGDDRRLVPFVCQAYGLKKIPTLGAGLYMLQWNSNPRSALRLTHLPVVRANATNMRMEIMLEINRPRSYYSLSPEFDQILKNDQENGRW